MGIKFEVEDGKAQLEISDFRTEAGKEYISIRRLYKDRDGKFWPQKNKNGGYNMIYIVRESWEEAIPRLSQYLGLTEARSTTREQPEPSSKDDF